MFDFGGKPTLKLPHGSGVSYSLHFQICRIMVAVYRHGSHSSHSTRLRLASCRMRSLLQHTLGVYLIFVPQHGQNIASVFRPLTQLMHSFSPFAYVTRFFHDLHLSRHIALGIYIIPNDLNLAISALLYHTSSYFLFFLSGQLGQQKW